MALSKSLKTLKILHTPQVIVAGGRTAEGALADGKNEVALRQNHVNFIVHHRNALLRHCAQRSIQTGHAIGNAAVVLDARYSTEPMKASAPVPYARLCWM